MPRVIVTPRAVADLAELTEALGLPANALRRVQASLCILERFPLAGRALAGRWQGTGTRFLIGPWPWLILIYLHDADADAVYVVAAHDGRSSSSATGPR